MLHLGGSLATTSTQTIMGGLCRIYPALQSARVSRTAIRITETALSTSSSTSLDLRGGAISSLPGLGAALSSPAASAVGFMIWSDHWRGGSAFSLNLVKNLVASLFFFLALSTTGSLPRDIFSVNTPLVPLAFSALLGVVIGDCTAIAALKRLGSRRYLLIDCMKPALASIAGVLFLNEHLTIRIAVGIAIIIVGVIAASSAKGGGGDSNSIESRDALVGYALAVAHLLLDTAGAGITKQYRGALGPFSIGLLRFGSAALMLMIIGLVGKISTKYAYPAFAGLTSNRSGDDKNNRKVRGWWSLPTRDVVTGRDWRFVVLGTFFVTFLGPALFLRSLFLMPFGIAATISCLGPLYEPLIARLLRGTRPNARAVAGAFVAICGVAVLCV